MSLQLFQTPSLARRNQYHILEKIDVPTHPYVPLGTVRYNAYCTSVTYPPGRPRPMLYLFNSDLELCVACIREAYKAGVINVVESARSTAES